MRKSFWILAIAAMLLSCGKKTTTLPVRGVDLGWLSEMEHDSILFYTEDGTPTDCIDLMQSLGADAVRLRVWVNHATGWCNKEDVLHMARRVHAHGMRLMIDFHYSDYWADPQQQNIPEDWKQLNEDELCIAIGAHTVDVLRALKAEGITPEWVQIGNETTYGMLWPIGRLHVDRQAPYGADKHWRTYARLSNSGYEAAKQVFPNIICITHIDNAFINRVPWFERFREAGGKWDMIGLSHYPFTQDTIAPLEMNRLAIADIRALDSAFHCPIMVVEIGTASWMPDSALTVMKDFVAQTRDLPGYAGAFYWEPECYGGWRPAEYIPLGWGSYGMGCMTEDGCPTETIQTLLAACAPKQEEIRTEHLLSEWQFTLLDSTDAPLAKTEQVTIPHDWAIAGPFDRKNDLQEVIVVQNGESEPTWKTGRSGGLPWMGRAVYRTTLCNRDYQLDSLHWSTLVIDGAMSHADVFINGEEVCYWPYGYNTFDCHLTPFLHGDSTTIEIYLENKPQQSRWYPGAGLYRHVHLISTAHTHIAPDGVWITTPKVDSTRAQIHIETTILNDIDTLREGYKVETEIQYQGKAIAHVKGANADVWINRPLLWSPETPHLYEVVTTLSDQKGHILDRTTTRMGIREISYTPEHGFQLNGQTRKFKGVCLHHDLGPLGAAVHKDAIRHQLTMLKDMGCDAIRTSHNMPAPELVELCDEMGLMMMLEPFDVWNWGKTDNDYHVEFDTYHTWDIEYMVRHYRSCPSVMLWSSGNEVWNQVLPDGIALVTHLQEIFHRLDPTRPVTCGMDQAKDVIYNGFGDAVELPGFNYRTSRYEEGYAHMHHKMLLGSETASTVSSRGVYKLPVVIQPDALYPDNQCSGYDVEYCAWSGLPEQDFQLQDDYPWTLGQFVWTGFDYLGEPSPYDTDAWPSHSSYFGIIDLASLPKDRYWLYRSQWNTKQPTLHVLPHWNWSEGDTVPVFCYTSYPEVELFVNGKSYGRLKKGESKQPKVGTFDIPTWGSAPRPELLPRYRRMWFDIPYEPGEIQVIAYDHHGTAVASRSIHTAGKPYALRAEWVNEKEHPEELCYITVSVVDRDGNVCPMADHVIHCKSKGFVATANGDATCLYSFVQPTMPAFAGQATFIVKKGAKATFTAKGLVKTSITSTN